MNCDVFIHKEKSVKSQNLFYRKKKKLTQMFRSKARNLS